MCQCEYEHDEVLSALVCQHLYHTGEPVAPPAFTACLVGVRVLRSRLQSASRPGSPPTRRAPCASLMLLPSPLQTLPSRLLHPALRKLPIVPPCTSSLVAAHAPCVIKLMRFAVGVALHTEQCNSQKRMHISDPTELQHIAKAALTVTTLLLITSQLRTHRIERCHVFLWIHGRRVKSADSTTSERRRTRGQQVAHLKHRGMHSQVHGKIAGHHLLIRLLLTWFKFCSK